MVLINLPRQILRIMPMDTLPTDTRGLFLIVLALDFSDNYSDNFGIENKAFCHAEGPKAGSWVLAPRAC